MRRYLIEGVAAPGVFASMLQDQKEVFERAGKVARACSAPE